MEDQKMDNLLNLALDSTENERIRSGNLNGGSTGEAGVWDVVVKYSGNPEALAGEGVRAVPLLGGYAVVTLPLESLEEYARRPEIEFMELPKRLYFQTDQGSEASCIRTVQRGSGEEPGLTGKGVLVGIVDSGVDYRHPDFRKEDGGSRILKLWDQSAPAGTGTPPEGYLMGVEYEQEEIDRALALPEPEGRALVPQQDLSGHGTAVLGIAAGNGRASGGVYRGAAYESDIIAVKLGPPRENSFPRTAELMQGVDYLIRQALRLGRPMAVNLSFGNNYGSHRGDSLLETYLSNAANVGRTVICVGTGNNGSDNLHASGRLGQGETKEIEFSVGVYEAVMNIQLWKSYVDEMEIYIEAPSGERIGPLSEKAGAQRYSPGRTELLVYYGKPGPFQVTQEIYFDFLPRDTYIESGIWKIELRGRRVREGDFFLWMPGGQVLNQGTGFYSSNAEETLTIPSTAAKVITVGAYDSRLNAFADFSGRGGRRLSYPKPDLAAPGVDITAPVPGGGYGSFTGTSFAVPFVTGSAALLMEFGIIRGRDPFLWGEKVKAYLRRGAQPLRGFDEYPNPEIGYGTLCLSASIPR